MTHKRYENYVDTQEAWLGSYPSHWGRKPLWTLFRRVKRQGFESEELLSVYRDHGVIPKSSREDNFNKPSDDLSAYQLVEPGDLAVNKMKAWQGSVAISKHRGIVSPAYHVYTSLHSENQRYLHYLMRCDRYITGYLAISKGIRVNQWDLQPEYHSRMPVLLPPLNEQLSIASFLDRETAKTDTLIAEQQRLIELLLEKKQAVISHAVTKGLNPNAPMKDSGVEWLGEVPEHWEVKAVKHLCSLLRDGTHLPPPRETIGIPLLSVRNIQKEKFAMRDDDSLISEDSYDELCRSFSPQPGDTLLAIVGATMGKTAIVPSDIGKFHIQRSLGIFRTKNKLLHPEWLNFVFRSSQFNGLLWRDVSFSAQPGIYLGTLKDVPIPVPTLPEQSEILRSSNKKLQDLSLLVAAAEHAVALHHERRSALISAAVTGQIDVRGLAEEEAGKQ